MSKLIDSNTDQYKSRIREYLEKSGVSIDDKKKPPLFRCVNPSHEDKKPSCVLYPEQAYCPSCGFKDDIFGVAGAIHNLSEFKDQLKNVKEVLGYDLLKQKTKTNKPKQIKIIPVSLPKTEAQEIYTDNVIDKLGKNFGERVHSWPYTDENNNIIAVDVRFENDNEKQVITFWYDGKKVLMKNRPALIYNLYEVLNENKKILIHEGCKCAEIGKEKITGFIHATWNGGANNVHKVGWNILKNKEIYVIRDNDEPGLKAANEIKKQLPNTMIIEPPENLPPKGDIEQYLEIMKPDEIKKYILSFEKKNEPQPPPNDKSNTDLEDETGFPFRILGMADDGMGYFLTRHEILYSTPMDALTKGKLLNLAPLEWWKEEYKKGKGQVDWDNASCKLIEKTGHLHFDPDKARGRGAWREPDGRISYNTGQRIIGEYDETQLYLKKRPLKVGLSDPPADKELRLEICTLIMNLNFETQIDAMYYMSWAVLAPFCGALPWRSSLLVTGATSVGKTTLAEYVSIPISMADNWNGGETTPAFLRQYYQNDSCAINMDESDRDTKKKKENVEALFSVMRQSTSDNAPKSGKGSANGKPISYTMKNMFMFDAISPEIEALADENRIFRINIIKPTNDWKKVKKDLVRLLNKKNCRAIRSLTWIKLKDILRAANKLTEIVQDVTGKGARQAYAEALLFSAYLIVWYGYDEIDYNFARTMLKEFHGDVEKAEEENYANALVDRLLDETVVLAISKNRKTIRSMLMSVYRNDETPEEENKKTLAQYGLAITKGNQVAIHTNHHEIMKIINHGKGYHMVMWRHTNLIDKYRPVRIDGVSGNRVIIGGLLEHDPDEPENREDEKDKDLFEE